ncbi:uncharacterized protein LOC100118669 [Nasonia vitripennis]|uniref:HTH CENPB-type domain-containing protein n=1 Tax=Nasonia vitripennis TaxID=7425 RepID=A0A7M7G3F5_NASVI|nr:uncharacterized protein LOC100118669 [Nasonia vitripennis]
MGHKQKIKIRCKWEKTEMLKAINSVLEKRLSMRAASHVYNVPTSTLLAWCKRARARNIKLSDIKRGYFQNVFTEQQENQLKQYVKEMKLSLYKMNSIQLRRIAFQFAEMNNIPHKFNKESGLAGYHWYSNFIKRQRLQEIEAADPLNDISPPSSGESYKTKTFPELLADLQKVYKFPANRIYNMNATVLISVPNMTTKIVCESDKHELQSEYITMVNCCNAAGDFVPPLMIYPASKTDPEFMKGCPQGTEIVCHPSGSLQSEIFHPTWFNHFVDHAKPSKRKPVLLLLNGNALCAKNLDFIEKIREVNVHILNIPKKIVHPLEVNFIPAMKNHYACEQNKWVRKTGLIINLNNIGKIIKRAYDKSAISSNAIDAFQASGIYPVNKEILIRTACLSKSSTSTTDNSDYTAGPLNDEDQNSDLTIRDPDDFSFFDDLINEENSNTSGSNVTVDGTNMPLEPIFIDCKEEFNETEPKRRKNIK